MRWSKPAFPPIRKPSQCVPEIIGAGQKSKFAKNASKGVTAANQPTGSDKAKIPAHNGPRSNVQLGTTKHGTGSVPGYLRGK